MSLLRAPATGVQRVPLLDEIIRGTALHAVYQPIVSLAEPERPIVGYESLARYSESMPLAAPDLLFEYAARKRMAVDLDLACLQRGLSGGAGLPSHQLRFLNLQPVTLEEGKRLVELIAELSQQGLVPQGRVVLELTEHVTFRDVGRAAEYSDALREMGCKFAFDDVGSGFSHLKLLERIKPEYVKLANEFGTDFEQSSFKRKIIEHQLALAHDFDARVILEGIETEATAENAAALGIDMGQGWHFGRPGPLPQD